MRQGGRRQATAFRPARTDRPITGQTIERGLVPVHRPSHGRDRSLPQNECRRGLEPRSRFLRTEPGDPAPILRRTVSGDSEARPRGQRPVQCARVCSSGRRRGNDLQARRRFKPGPGAAASLVRRTPVSPIRWRPDFILDRHKLPRSRYHHVQDSRVVNQRGQTPMFVLRASAAKSTWRPDAMLRPPAADHALK